MTTLKDKIRDEVIEYMRESANGVPDDAEVLTETIINVIKDYFEGQFE